MESLFTFFVLQLLTHLLQYSQATHNGAKQQKDHPHQSPSMSLICAILLFVLQVLLLTAPGSWVVSFSHLCSTPRPHPRHPLTYACETMGSVSSVIGGDSLSNKHYQASDYRIRKGTKPHRRSGGCSLDGLLNCGFTQGSSSNNHPSKGLTHSRSGRSEDFFYIKVTFWLRHKTRLFNRIITTATKILFCQIQGKP